jgi:hypothetical protein
MTAKENIKFIKMTSKENKKFIKIIAKDNIKTLFSLAEVLSQGAGKLKTRT